MNVEFIFDQRLKISIPRLHTEWENLDLATQSDVLSQWEEMRGDIPDRVKETENLINKKQAELANEMDFDRSCSINNEIAELASIINDLWIWFRTNPSVTATLTIYKEQGLSK